MASAAPPERKKRERERPKLTPALSFIDAILEADRQAPRKQRHTAHRVRAGARIDQVAPRERRYAKNSSVLFHDVVHRDPKTGRILRQVLRKSKLVDDQAWKQQVAGGMWVHWIQKGMDPEAWGELFVGDKRCLLIREEKVECRRVGMQRGSEYRSPIAQGAASWKRNSNEHTAHDQRRPGRDHCAGIPSGRWTWRTGAIA